MWLDRFSGHSTPAGSPPPPSRLHSPAPSRRPSHLAPNAVSRPSFGPRSTSINSSARFDPSTSSLNSPRLPNGSALKREITPPADYADPLEALQRIVGKPADPTVKRGDALQKPPGLVEDIEFSGLGLQEFLEDESEQNTAEEKDDQHSITQTFEENESDGDKYEDLHRSILACDDVLKSVEISLSNFQKDLGTVSAEIETLQSRSTALNMKLENRKVVEKLLGPAIEEICISPVVVNKIAFDPIDRTWGKALEELEKRSRVIGSKLEGSEKSLAALDVKPLLDDLTNLAVERIRDFFVSQIKALRSPRINAQIIQQMAFLAYKDLYGFLSRHHAQLAEEIGQAYINTMRWYYLSHFMQYKQALDKIPLFIVDKHDALGAEQKGAVPSASKTAQPTHDALALGRRVDVLKHASSAALPSYLAEDSKTLTNLENPFHAFNTALIDNASFEYTFLTAFFPNVSFHTISRYFDSIFSPTFALGHSLTKQLVDTTYDCLGILLCVRLNQHLAFELQRRKCPVADGYVNGTNMSLWPRFQVAMDMHVDSVRRSTSSLTGGARATLFLTGSGGDTKGSTAPHVLTQRFGQFLQGILSLSSHEMAASGTGEAQMSDIEPVARSLERLRSEMEAFLTKAAKGLAQGKRERFLDNNYSLILTIIGDTGGGLAKETREWFEQLREGVRG